jgi:hypothetical protein
MFMLPSYLLKLTTNSKNSSKNTLITYSYYSFCDLKCVRRGNSITRLNHYLGDPYDGENFYSEQLTSGKRTHGSSCD